MIRVKLGDICTVVSGSTPKTGNPENWDGEIKWITPAELSEDSYYLYDSVRHITEEGRVKTGLSFMPKGTVILSSRAPIGKTAILGCEMCCNQGFKNLICSDVIYNEYLYHFLKCNTEYLNSLGRGATFKEISKSIVEGIDIPLPDYEEQISIAHRIHKIDTLISLRKQQLAKLDELVKARFVELFGNPLDGTAKYPIHQVGEVAEAVDPQPSHRTPPIEEGGIPYVSIKDCDYKTGTIDFDGARRVSRKVLEEHLNRYTLQDGDFVIGKIGTIGKPVFVPARNDYTLSANVVLVQPNNELVSPYFLKYSFESDFVERQFSEAKNSTSQAAFGIQKVRAVEVMNPDLDIQRAFERFVKQTDKSKSAIQQSLDKLETLKGALMQKYFGRKYEPRPKKEVL